MTWFAIGVVVGAVAAVLVLGWLIKWVTEEVIGGWFGW